MWAWETNFTLEKDAVKFWAWDIVVMVSFVVLFCFAFHGETFLKLKAVSLHNLDTSLEEIFWSIKEDGRLTCDWRTENIIETGYIWIWNIIFPRQLKKKIIKAFSHTRSHIIKMTNLRMYYFVENKNLTLKCVKYNIRSSNKK